MHLTHLYTTSSRAGLGGQACYNRSMKDDDAAEGKSETIKTGAEIALHTVLPIVGTGVLPGIGTIVGSGLAIAGTRLIDWHLKSKLEKRAAVALRELNDDVLQVSERVNKQPAELLDNDQFTSMLLQAIPMLIRSHQEEKRETLRNVVLNSTLPGAPEDDLQYMILSVVDSLTPTHILYLKLLSDPRGTVIAKRGRLDLDDPDLGSPGGTFRALYPDLTNKQDLIQRVEQDFRDQQLQNSYAGPMAWMRGKMPEESCLSEWGQLIFAAVTSPFSSMTSGP
jgi:hypothetical protein